MLVKNGVVNVFKNVSPLVDKSFPETKKLKGDSMFQNE